ncbi:phosphotransferase family protein [Gordonia sp. CPCC 205333]|uniref:phosphotransferase family protein n=1 Tax=Gordonia sp. CPCC 205333 TaxID=3140790 RepID=UPI003AF37E1B
MDDWSDNSHGWRVSLLMARRQRYLDDDGQAAVAAWLENRLPGFGEVTVAELEQSAGNSHQLFTVTRETGRWVMRVAPSGREYSADGGFDLHHEWRVLNAISNSAIPHAKAVIVSDSSCPVDNAILVIEYVDGHVLYGQLPDEYASVDDARQIVNSIVDTLATISRFAWASADIASPGIDADTYLERQCTKGRRILESSRTRDTPLTDRLFDHLEQTMPATSTLGLIHGDYSPMNIMVHRGGNPSVAAVIDWETGTVGDVLIDIGYLTARWVRPDENPLLATFALGGGNADHHRLLPDKGYVAQRFSDVSGLSVDSLPYYQGFAMARLAVAIEPRVARAARRDDEQTAALFGAMVDTCAQHGLALAGA